MCEALLHRGFITSIFYITYSRICRGNLPRKIAVAICRENLPWEFAAGIFRGNFSQQFFVAICRGFFVFVSKSFFVYGRKSCLYESKPFFICERNVFICEIFFITVFLFAIAVAVVGHRTKRF